MLAISLLLNPIAHFFWENSSSSKLLGDLKGVSIGLMEMEALRHEGDYMQIQWQIWKSSKKPCEIMVHNVCVWYETVSESK